MKILALIFCLSVCGTACAADSQPVASFFPLLPLDALDSDEPQWIPVIASQSLADTHSGVTLAIVNIHNSSRDAGAALQSLSQLAGGLGQQTLIIAPQFLLPSDIAAMGSHLPNNVHDFAVWDYQEWPWGGDSTAQMPHKPISSFTALDTLLMYLSDRDRFPDLDTVVVTGFGTGANFVQRYAAFSAAAPALTKQGLVLRFVVAGATSYLYLTASRPLGGRKGIGRPDITTCPEYNAYPYGLEKLTAYARHIGVNAAKINYSTQNITYLASSGADAVPDKNCGALLQGGGSAMRLQNFSFYLSSLYGDDVASNQHINIIKDGRNDAMDLLGSPCGMAALFGDGCH